MAYTVNPWDVRRVLSYRDGPVSICTYSAILVSFSVTSLHRTRDLNDIPGKNFSCREIFFWKINIASLDVQQGARSQPLPVELNSIPEETDALQHWHLKEAQYASISKLSFALVTDSSSEVYVQREFSLYRDLSTIKRNRV